MVESESALSTLMQKAACQLGYKSLKPEQESAISSFVCGNDVFVSLPTGFGKSLCFAILPSVFDALKGVEKTSIVLVISPLLSIISNQVASFCAKGIAAAFVGDEDKSVVRGIKRGEYQLVFISPESLFCTMEWRQVLCTDIYLSNLVAVVIDEAHCIKKWGESFRREFSQLGELRSFIRQEVHVMAMTATATLATRRCIFKTLHMTQPKVVYVRPIKNNITYQVVKKTSIQDVFSPIIRCLLKERVNMGRIIIFCKQYTEVGTIYRYFKKSMEENFTEPIGAPDLSRYRLVEMFTRCTQDYVKETIVAQFTKPSQLRIVIGTIAFGMGIDSPDVRGVINWGASADCEMYVQESGRAGRDGLQSCATTYYGKGDLNKKFISPQMIKYCVNADNLCRREILFEDFDDCDGVVPEPLCLCCDTCQIKCDCIECL